MRGLHWLCIIEHTACCLSAGWKWRYCSPILPGSSRRERSETKHYLCCL